jgi:arylsulfatase A-like enzyme
MTAKSSFGASCWMLLLAVAFPCPTGACAAQGPRPNILWITSEDNGPHLGAYGDKFAVTPHLDRLAARGMIYTKCWSNAPVCAPARTAIISGMYPTSTGSEHMRSMVRLPAGMQMGPQFLRAAGYYCTNNAKEDYNLEKPGPVWDESSNRAHWKNRGAGQPFFAVFNILVTHESQIRARPHEPVHDPASVRVPAYHPDAPEVRQDWAQYYDKMTEMDAIAGRHLQELSDAGLADDTIIFYYGDHGPGMPRCKRWPYQSGLGVPLIVYVPPKYRDLAPRDYAPGGSTNRLVSFVDLAPTILSLAGIDPPAYMQGRAFAGRFEAPPREYVHGFRGRMDERSDMVRTVRDQRYVYVRNYLPHLIYGQHVAYMFETPTTRIWKCLYDEGRLNPAQSRFWQTKPAEELYDLSSDPDEVDNLAENPALRGVLDRLRAAEREHALSIRDVGFLPEAEMHRRSRGSTPYEVGHDDAKYPLHRVLTAADRASSMRGADLPALRQLLSDEDSAVRYWSAMGVLMRGKSAVDASRGELAHALEDESPSVRIAAAEALGRYGNDAELELSLRKLVELASVERHGLFVTVQALSAIDALGPKALSIVGDLREAQKGNESISDRMKEYVPRLIESIEASTH